MRFRYQPAHTYISSTYSSAISGAKDQGFGSFSIDFWGSLSYDTDNKSQVDLANIVSARNDFEKPILREQHDRQKEKQQLVVVGRDAKTVASKKHSAVRQRQ
jgi:VCBS repeat-containing protein